MSARQGPPKHQNKFAWNPNAGHKKNEKELGGKFRPYSEITGVCPKCKDQIEWKRRYGKYKPLVEPTKCHKCTKRAVRQAYHSLCSGCAKDFNVCAKCCCIRDQIVGRDASEVEAERKALDEEIKNARERDRRTLLRAILMKGYRPNRVARQFGYSQATTYNERPFISDIADLGDLKNVSPGTCLFAAAIRLGTPAMSQNWSTFLYSRS